MRGGCTNYVIIHHANVFSLMRTIFYDIKVVPLTDNTNSLENLPQGCKTGLITYRCKTGLIPCNEYSFFPSFSFIFFLHFLLFFHEYANEIILYYFS